MQLVQVHNIRKSNKFYNELQELTHLSKNLYNASLYQVRQHFFNQKKYLNKYEVINRFTGMGQEDYISLPRKVSQQVIFQVDQNFKSFFGSLKSKNVDHKVKIPRYLNKNGNQILTYTNQAISIKQKGYVKLSGSKVKIKTERQNIKQVRVIPRCGYFKVQIVYNYKQKELKKDNKRYKSIDIGLNNLATVCSNVDNPYIINGRPLKSINQYYNKKLSMYKSRQDKLQNKNICKKKIENLAIKRNNKIKDYLHKSSQYIINQLVSKQINSLIIGLNKQWKQEINIGKKNNQNFVDIPHSKFIQMLKYKGLKQGINVIVREQSYTSKCSFIDNQQICKHNVYLGKRIKRGLFKSKDNHIINADVNASLNILKKEVPNAFSYAKSHGIEVCSSPTVLTVK